MMKSMNYLLLAIMGVSLSAPAAIAGVIHLEVVGNREKDSIYAHTGQDPLHRNLEGNQTIDVLFEGWDSSVQRLPLDLTDAIVQNNLNEIDWLRVHSISVDRGITIRGDVIDWNTMQYPNLVNSNILPLGGNSIPTPSALLVLISGLGICKRRKQ
jgi:hypothetical protein